MRQFKNRTPECPAPECSIRTRPSEQAVNTVGPRAGHEMLTSPMVELMKEDWPARLVHESLPQRTLAIRMLPTTLLGPTRLISSRQSEKVVLPYPSRMNPSRKPTAAIPAKW